MNVDRLLRRAVGSHLAAAVIALAAAQANASLPPTMSYQGILTNASSTPVNGSISMTFRIYNVASGGSALWQETQPSVAVTNGQFSTTLGSVTPIALIFDVPYYLGVTVGADTEMTPRQALASSAYAFRAGCIPGDRVTCYSAGATVAPGCSMGMRLCNGDGLGWGSCTGEVTPNCNGNCVNLAGDPSNCGTCGNACSGGANGAAMCTGGGCGFTCNSGFRHCSGQAGIGCECAGTGCCPGGSCQSSHSNGLGQSYFDCSPLGTPGTASTYTAAMANEAALASTLLGSVSTSTCSTSSVTFKAGATQCAVWAYSGPLAGRVLLGGSSCLCPSATDASWN